MPLVTTARLTWSLSQRPLITRYGLEHLSYFQTCINADMWVGFVPRDRLSHRKFVGGIILLVVAKTAQPVSLKHCVLAGFIALMELLYLVGKEVLEVKLGLQTLHVPDIVLLLIIALRERAILYLVLRILIRRGGCGLAMLVLANPTQRHLSIVKILELAASDKT